MKPKGYYYAEIILNANDAGTYNWTLRYVNEQVNESEIAHGTAASPHLAFVKAQEALTDQHALDERKND